MVERKIPHPWIFSADHLNAECIFHAVDLFAVDRRIEPHLIFTADQWKTRNVATKNTLGRYAGWFKAPACAVKRDEFYTRCRNKRDSQARAPRRDRLRRFKAKFHCKILSGFHRMNLTLF